LEFLKQVFQEKNVLVFDLVELCPNEVDKSSDFLAAKLYYKMLSYKFMGVDIDKEYDNTYDVDYKANNSHSRFDEDEE
jgi:agmatinase